MSESHPHYMAIDDEISKYRICETEIQKHKYNQQTLYRQKAENEMVKQEFQLLNTNDQVYKKIGPLLLKHGQEEAKSTITQRLNMIHSELKKVNNIIDKKSKEGMNLMKKIQEMQTSMQCEATEAAKKVVVQYKK